MTDLIAKAYLRMKDPAFLTTPILQEDIILTESQILLVENRVEFLKTQFKDKIDASFDTTAKHTSSDDIIDHLANKADPTANKAHTQWLVGQYRKQTFRQEDASRVKKDLKNFEKVKGSLEKKDINQYQTIHDLRDAVVPQLGRAQEEEKAKKQYSTEKEQGLQKLYEDDGVHGFKIPSKAASISYYGPAGKACKTTWCTAANSANNMFNNYKGGKYTMHFPNGKALQFHHQSNQMMDENDRPININTNDGYSPYKEHIQKFVEETHHLEYGKDSDRSVSPMTQRIVGYKPEEVDTIISDGHTKAEKMAKERIDSGRRPYVPASTFEPVRNVAENANLSDEQFQKIHTIAKLHGRDAYDDYNRTLTSLGKNPSLNEHQYASLLHDGGAIRAMGDNRNVHGDELLHNLIDKQNESKLSLGDVSMNPHLNESHVRKLISMGSEHVLKNDAVNIPHDIQFQHFEKNKITMSSRPDLHPDLTEKILRGDDMQSIVHVIQNQPLHHDQISRLIAHPYSSIHNAILNDENQNPTHEQIHAIIDKGLGENKAVDARSPKLNEDHLSKLIKEGDVSQANSAMSNPNVKSKHIDEYLARGETSEYQLTNLAKHRAAKPGHVKNILGKYINAKAGRSYIAPVLESKHIDSNDLHSILDSEHPDRYLKMSVLEHPSAQKSHFDKLVPDIRTHGMISSSKKAPPSILHQLASSELDHVRLNVSKNKNTPDETIHALRQDQNDEVRLAAAARRTK